MIHFPVVVPYKTHPTMYRNTGHIVEPVKDKVVNRNLKSLELNRWNTDLWACRRPDLVKLACKVMDVPETDHIVTFALNFKEDVAILHNDVLSSICFCYPSSWIPSHNIGKTLTEIHRPVADGETLRKASPGIGRVMSEEYSFRRWVWTISTTGALSNLPRIEKPPVTENTTIDDLYFRLETQTTLPLGNGESSLFFVNVETCPLHQFWDDIEKRQTIVDSVNSMSDAVLEYKNLIEIKKILNKNIAV